MAVNTASKMTSIVSRWGIVKLRSFCSALCTPIHFIVLFDCHQPIIERFPRHGRRKGVKVFAASVARMCQYQDRRMSDTHMRDDTANSASGRHRSCALRHFRFRQQPSAVVWQTLDGRAVKSCLVSAKMVMTKARLLACNSIQTTHL